MARVNTHTPLNRHPHHRTESLTDVGGRCAALANMVEVEDGVEAQEKLSNVKTVKFTLDDAVPIAL